MTRRGGRGLSSLPRRFIFAVISHSRHSGIDDVSATGGELNENNVEIFK